MPKMRQRGCVSNVVLTYSLGNHLYMTKTWDSIEDGDVNSHNFFNQKYFNILKNLCLLNILSLQSFSYSHMVFF